MVTTLQEAIAKLCDVVKNTEISVTADKDGDVSIYWHGVTRLDCTPAIAAKAIPMLKQLESFGMDDSP